MARNIPISPIDKLARSRIPPVDSKLQKRRMDFPVPRRLAGIHSQTVLGVVDNTQDILDRRCRT
jgi:hypothetical protein